MINNLIQILKMLSMLLPFAALVGLNCKANLKKKDRYKQFLMPFAAVIICAVIMFFLSDIYDMIVLFMLRLDSWLTAISEWLYRVMPDKLDMLGNLVTKLANYIRKVIQSINLNYWAFYITNAALFLAYIIVKKFVLLFLKGLFKDGGLFQIIAGQFYDYDEDSDSWCLKPQFCQARTFLKTLYIIAAALGAVAVIVTSRLYLNGALTAVFYPVFSIIILGELYFFLNGLTLKERKHELTGEAEESEKTANYSIMCRILRALFPDKLSAENTTVSDPQEVGTTKEELLTALESSVMVAEEAYGRFMRQKSEAGMDLDFNYLLSGKQLLGGQSVLFNNPFYYDLIPYIFYPMNRTLLRRKKVLIILGRHGVEEGMQKWCVDGLTAVTNIPSMWNVGLLTEDQQDLDVGIVTRSSVHDLKMHEANRQFFDEVEFVVLIEPSRLVTTAQVGLNSLVRHCRRKQKQLVFCSTDKNCDGLLDALSHLLMTNIQEVAATTHHKGASSYMIWEADGEHLQHRLLPNISRYLGMGTELSFAALKNQVPQTQWYGGDAFPVVDIHWIAKQYYYDLMRYAGIPASQENMDRVFNVSPDMWNSPVKPNQYITVEDESFNMFEIKRAFSTRATEQGFINVICSDYMLKDYMAANDSIFNADPKAIPYITADHARTARNVILRLCLRMSTGMVPESEVIRELSMIDRDVTNPARSLWNEICANCGHVGTTDSAWDGTMVLHCNTASGEMTFTSDVLTQKRRFNMDTGAMDTMYCITDRYFIKTVLSDLRSAEYVAEDENGNRRYLGTELRGHVFQKYLPGQMFTFGGKYYEMLRVTTDGQVLVRRASEHIDGRPYYRQERSYFISNCVDSTVMGECRDMGVIRVVRQHADIRVETPAYWQMKRYNDFSTARKVKINGVPERRYNNKAILRIDFNGDSPLKKGTASTLALLINEVMRTLFAENQDYLVAVAAGEAQLPGTYSLHDETVEVQAENCIYLIEDSQMDIGLLDAADRHLNRIFAIICDYLQWHEETLAAEEKSNDPAGGEGGPDAGGEGGGDTEQPGEAEKGKKKGGIFGKIGGFFRAIAEFFKKLFGKLFKRKKKKPEQEEPADGQETPEEEAVPAEDTPNDVPETEAGEELSGEQTDAEAGEAAPEEASEDEEASAEEEEPEEEGSFASMSLFNQTGIAFADEEAEEVEGEPTATAEGADNDTLEFEPEKVIKPGSVPSFQRLPYKERYYLRYGGEAYSQSLQLGAVKDLLVSLGYGNNALTQARKGKDVAAMVERDFVPNREGSHYCDFCGCELTGVDYDVLGDGRERCSMCGRTAVKDLAEFVALHDAVLRNMKLFFGVKINAPVSVQMVNSKKLHRKLGKSFVPSGKFDGRVLGVAIKDRKGYTILVENGAPKLQSTMTMVHEMTHIWQYLNWDSRGIKKTYGKLELEVYEGMAKWVEIQYAYLLNETATAKREELITRHRQDEYGQGFLKYVDKYPLSMGPGNTGNTPFDNTSKPL